MCLEIFKKLCKISYDWHNKTDAGETPEKEPEDRTCVLEDIVKRWRGGTDLAVLACESQARIHYAMPVRNMLYDSLTYTEQIRQVWKLHENKRDKGNREAVDTADTRRAKIQTR